MKTVYNYKNKSTYIEDIYVDKSILAFISEGGYITVYTKTVSGN